jgi:prepilin-type N-terminal cleavage/methylation domain-containing protein
MSIFRIQSEKGFTLVEILVVCAVIGILATVVYGTFDGARKKSRDTQRKSDLKQLELALRVYKDTYGEYPDAGCSVGQDTSKWTGPGPGPGSGTWYVECNNYVEGIAPELLPVLPTDPLSENISQLGYLYQTNGTDYKVLVHGSVESGAVSKGEEFARCPNVTCTASQDLNCSRSTYAVYSPGAACW